MQTTQTIAKGAIQRLRGDKPNNEETPVWHPQVGPQTAGYESLADELFYGGQAGGGKSELLLGLAGTKHRNSIIFRRVFPSMRSLIERSREIFNAAGDSHSKDTFNETLHIWRLASGRLIEFGSLQYEKDKRNYQGRPHDLYGWDEITEFTESQFRFVNAWNRSTYPGQRCRIVATGNPPTDISGEWVIHYWGPWLDDQHKNPAKPGELRWFAMVDGKEVEVESGDSFDWKGETINPRSRTFIPARLEDNPILMATGYGAVLEGLPEPLRSQLRGGMFTLNFADDPWQVIPTKWVLEAQARWENTERPDLALRSVGVDVARGGQDETVIAPLRGVYFDEPVAHPGETTPDGATSAKYVTDVLGEENPPVYVDVIGYGASTYDHLKAMPNLKVYGVNNAAGSKARDKTKRYGFLNLRAESYWKFREALDPASGENIALPPTRQIRIDLCAPRYSIVGGKIKVEPKEDIIKRTGRSPDYGDAVVLAWHGVSEKPAVATVVANPFYEE